MTNNEPKPKNTGETREKILEAALQVFSSKGYHDTRLDEIVEASGTSKGSIYFHFPNKERLFVALVDKFSELLERRVTESVAHNAPGMVRVQAALEAVLNTFGKYRRPAKILLVQAAGLGSIFEQKRIEVHDRFSDLIKHYLDEAVALGEIDALDTEIVSRAWMGAINELVIRWVYTGEPQPSQIIDTLVPMLLRSVGYNAQTEAKSS